MAHGHPDAASPEGYILDLDYTESFYRELAPARLHFVTLLQGLRAASIDSPYTYYELGCGHGYSSALLAAANPLGRFIGVDFNPTHIQSANELAQAAGLDNVRFLEKSFADLLEMDLPAAEFITLHGVWSWLDDPQRAQVVEFMRRKLKPGGIAYISYNALPGLAQVEPLQRLLLEYGNAAGGERLQRMRQALQFVMQLERAGAEYFRANPVATARLHRLSGQDPRYVAHEYFNPTWALFYHAEVSRQLAPAGLSFAGSADPTENFDQLVVKPEVAALLAAVGDRAMVETIKDFAANRVFRRDVFTRGAASAAPPEREAMLAKARFALARPRGLCALTRRMPHGEVTLAADPHAKLLDALARAPTTFAELASAPQTRGVEPMQLRQALFRLAAFDYVAPALRGGEAQASASVRFNRALLARPRSADQLMLASPVLGSGVPMNVLDRIFLAHDRPDDGIRQARALLAQGPVKLRKGEREVSDPEEARQLIEARARLFYDELAPYLRQIAVMS
jgi:SAM-dependent methyltransferase